MSAEKVEIDIRQFTGEQIQQLAEADIEETGHTMQQSAVGYQIALTEQPLAMEFEEFFFIPVTWGDLGLLQEFLGIEIEIVENTN